MKYLCKQCNLNIWTMVVVNTCPICKGTNIQLVSQLNYEGSDVDTIIRLVNTPLPKVRTK